MELSTIIGAEEWDAFLDAYQRRDAGFRLATLATRFAQYWSAWELDALYQFTLLPDGDTFRLFLRGKQVPAVAYRDRSGTSKISVIQQLWNSGVSVNYARMELFSNPVLALVRELEAAVRCPVRAHFFATPPRAQALGVHADHEDVLILQLQGEKIWDVYHNSPRWTAERGEVSAASLLAPQQLVLRAGSWLFLPKGMYHEVRNVAMEPSMHITFGFHTLSWATLLARAAEMAKTTTSPFSEAVLVGGYDGGTEAELSARVLALRPFIERVLTADHYGERLPETALATRESVEALTAETWCRWGGADVTMAGNGSRLQLSLPYRATPLELRPAFEPALRRAVALGSFQVKDLPLESESAVLLARYLANVGCIML